MSAGEETRLALELEYYESMKSEWLHSHPGEFVLIKGRESLGFFPTFESGYKHGIARLGEESDFLVKRIVAHEPVFVLY